MKFSKLRFHLRLNTKFRAVCPGQRVAEWAIISWDCSSPSTLCDLEGSFSGCLQELKSICIFLLSSGFLWIKGLCTPKQMQVFFTYHMYTAAAQLSGVKALSIIKVCGFLLCVYERKLLSGLQSKHTGIQNECQNKGIIISKFEAFIWLINTSTLTHSPSHIKWKYTTVCRLTLCDNLELLAAV